MTQKAEEIIQQKECESGFALCKSIPEKVEGDEEKSEELKPPPKIPSGHHKPTIKVNFKNIIQTNEPKGIVKRFSISLTKGLDFC